MAVVVVMVAVAAVVALVLASGAVPLVGVAVIPVAGILVGAAMTATWLAGRLVDQTRTVGPVTLPGALIGVLVGRPRCSPSGWSPS